MKLGVTLSWPEDAAAIGPEVERIARTADAAGVDSVWTADHFFQIPVTGLPREAPMLEAYATIAHVAAITEHIGVGALVTCPVYRHPGVLLKALTTIDVLSGGRLVFGVGAGWDAEEAAALGVPFPPLGERFERLEEVLRIAHRMWSDDTSPFEGRHYTLQRPLNSPPCLQRPRPPILVAGGGERRTLRLVAEYADACSLFDLAPPYGHDVPRKLEVLRRHCEEVGRDPSEIEVSVFTMFDATGGLTAGAERLIERVHQLGAIGVDHVIVGASTFEWGEELDVVCNLVDEIHAITPAG